MKERINEDYTKYYDIIEIIGNGAYGCVSKGKEKKTNELRAIKVINLLKIKEALLDKCEVNEVKKQFQLCIDGFIQEFENMKICSKDNKNSVKCYEYFNNETYFVLIMELCDKNLSQLLTERIFKYNKRFNEKEILKILNELNNTFRLMAQNNIIHRDLKLENILIKYIDNQNYIIKISDYGSSKKLISFSRYCSSYVGTIIYMAPEILNEEKYNYKCDLWSLGIIIYKLYFGKFPYPGETEKAIIKNIELFGNKYIQKTGIETLDDLIGNLLQKDSSKRLSWNEYFNHPIFKDNNCTINIKNINKTFDLIYKCNKNRIENIFGNKFVENNKNNIELIINGVKAELVSKYELKNGENRIKIILKREINNLEYMFYGCKCLKNIEELKYLDVGSVTNFSFIFSGCESLSDINSLENWNVSNGENFSHLFHLCTSLSDINPLQKWNVENGRDFSGMFMFCKSLSNIKALQNWNVFNNYKFSSMFCGCTSLSDINPLHNWNVENGNNFSCMFSCCTSLSDINPLQNWSVSNGKDFSGMFVECKFLSDIKPLEKWNVSNNNNFSLMFLGCSSLLDLNPIKYWNVSNVKNFEMFIII